ncbi:MAG TPA: anti-sigma factor [Thermoleophilaceae bacterium]|jgi:anti-sigma-K factor RskA|nr:anti-sigma factor [Thermoleophilaceae bacterium]
MTARDHTHYREDIGAYLLGALTDLERQAFERHIVNCAECRDEIEQLRPAADALPRSVDQVEPPPALKVALMEIVEREAGEASQEASAPSRRRSLRERLRIPAMRPALALGALLLGLVAGFAVAQLGDDDDERTIVATVDQSRLPRASGDLQVEGDGKDGAILRVRNMPTLEEGQVYQAWVQRDGSFVAQPTFEVGSDGAGAAAVPDDLSDAQAVLVTRERRGGARAPTERPVINVPL